MRKHLPLAVFLLALAFCAAAILWQSQGLPERVATRFGADGQANGWMTRGRELAFFLSVGLGVPCFIVGIVYSFRWNPGDTLNVPNADYWRAPEHYPQACEIAFRSSLGAGTAAAVWVVAVHGSIAAANRQAHPMLDTAVITHASWILAGAMAVWIGYLWWRFSRIP